MDGKILRVEHQGIDHGVPLAKQRNWRKLVKSVVKGCYDDGKLNLRILALAAQSIGLPTLYKGHALHETGFGIVREGDSGAVGQHAEPDAVAQLVTDKHGVALLERLEERTLHRDQPARLKGVRVLRMQGGDRQHKA